MLRTLAITALTLTTLMGADWTRFRGPGGSGVSRDTGLPTTWSATENVVWKTEMPGFGSSSPITLGDKIFLTSYSGYGLDAEEPGAEKNLTHHLLCVDRTSGKILWDKTSKALLPEHGYSGFQKLHGYASATPVTDGKNVYAFFGRSGVRAYTIDGTPLWTKTVGDGTHSWGSGASPILCGEILIVNASIESGSMFGFNKTTGKKVWQVEEINQSWSTPIVVELPGGKKELAVSIKNKVLGFDPATGKKLWECESINDYVCPMLVANGDVIYASGGRGPVTIAVKAGGRGDVTDTHRVWKIETATKVPSPLYHEGLLHWVSDKGYACCISASDGTVIYKERLKVSGRGDKIYASMVLADGKLYVVSRTGGTIVLAAGKELKELARNDLGDESVFNGTPVISNGQLLLRSDKYLYCIGKK
jgi:outer membrane protein assembly factor BamB